VVFASSTGRQYSLEDQAWGNGVFNKALVEGLGGKADDTSKGTISINMLDLYLSERVKQLTGGKQTPRDHQTQHRSRLPDHPAALRPVQPFLASSSLQGAASSSILRGRRSPGMAMASASSSRFFSRVPRIHSVSQEILT